VDLKLESAPHGRLEIVGQIARESDPQESLEGLVVQVVLSRGTVCETATNRFGEFLIESAHEKKATLRLGLKHRGQRIDLPLRDFL
jgi:hypothetical protein